MDAREYHPRAFALKAAVDGRTGLRDAASNSTSRRSEKPGAPVQMVFLRSISSIRVAQDRAIGSFSASARMVVVFSMARRNRYQYEIGMRFEMRGGTWQRSSTMAPKPPAWSR